MIAARFRAFSPLHIHHSYTRKWMHLEGKCLIRRKTPDFSFAHCDQIVAPFDTPFAPLESSHQALNWVSVSFSWFDTSPRHIFPRRVYSPLSNQISSLTTLVFGAPLCLHTCPCLCGFLSWATLLYSCFYGPPLDLYCVATPSSRPCLEHLIWVIIAFMESIPSPFVPRYSPPSFIAWSLSRVAHDGIQSHYPLSLLILCQSLPSHRFPLCSNKGSRPSDTQYPPFHHHH